MMFCTCHDDVVSVPEVEEGDLVDPLLEAPFDPVPQQSHFQR
jgi:hypothetical protein